MLAAQVAEINLQQQQQLPHRTSPYTEIND